jgi:ribosomal protein S18 acetylase RimI-like enzyme
VLDPSALARAITKLGGDRETLASMAEASARIARERFDEDAVVEKVMASYRDGLKAKGLGHLLPAGMLAAPPRPRIRSAGRRDVRALAERHASEIPSGFLPMLGRRFMRILYQALIAWKGALVLVVDDGGGPVAFAAGVVDVGAFYDHFAKRYAWRAGLAALPRLIRPSILRRAREAYRYGQSRDEVSSELLSMVVAPRARGRGLSVMLGARLLDELTERGVPAVKVIVGSENESALAAYRKMGFRNSERIQGHEVLVWRP